MIVHRLCLYATWSPRAPSQAREGGLGESGMLLERAAPTCIAAILCNQPITLSARTYQIQLANPPITLSPSPIKRTYHPPLSNSPSTLPPHVVEHT